MLSQDFTAKITDFGESRVVGDGTKSAGKGAEAFRSPEAHTNSYGMKSDVWSIGIVLAMLVQYHKWIEVMEVPANHPENYSCSVMNTFVSNNQNWKKIAAKRLYALDNFVPEEECFKAICRACLRWNPEERPSFAEIIGAPRGTPAPVKFTNLMDLKKMDKECRKIRDPNIIKERK